jgi:phage terminase large subunit
VGRREIIEIPYSPRPLQAEFHDRQERFALLVCHRRFGKTVMAINDLVRKALRCPLPEARVAYMAPLYRQAKAVAWDYVQKYTRPIPGMKYNQAELRADFPNGARLSLYGADNPDSLRGIYLDGCVLDEYAQMSERLWGEVIRPALADRKGSATFIGTPQGYDAFFDLYEQVKNDPEWYVRIHRASDTHYVGADELSAARKQMSAEQYEQEFECSWSAAVMGSYYGKLIDDAHAQNRLRETLNPDKGVKVETWWDLGMGDSTAIWFAQRSGPEVRILDYYEASGEALSHYAGVLEQKAKERGWLYGDHVVPHDARQRSLDSGRTRLDTLKSLGINATVQAAQKVEDGIEAVRRLLPSCWFDEPRCRRGLDALRQYRAEYDDVRRTFRLKPVHDWASHAADAFRYGAMHKPTTRKWDKIEYDNKGIV